MVVKLPQLYSESYHLSLDILAKTKGFPKHYRPTLARRLEDRTLDLCMSVRKLFLTKKQLAEEKERQTLEASHAVDDLKFLWQLCRDLKLISAGSFGEVAEKLSLIGEQIGGLIRRSRKIT